MFTYHNMTIKKIKKCHFTMINMAVKSRTCFDSIRNFFVAVAIAVGGMTLSFLDPTLQHHLQEPVSFE